MHKTVIFSFPCAYILTLPVFTGSFLGRSGGWTFLVGLSLPPIYLLSHSLDFSIAKKYFQGLLNCYYFGMENHELESLESTQKAKEWGQSCKNHNHCRSQALPEKFSTCCEPHPSPLDRMSLDLASTGLLLLLASPRPSMWVWMEAELVSLVHWEHPLRRGAEPALLSPYHLDQFSHTCSKR